MSCTQPAIPMLLWAERRSCAVQNPRCLIARVPSERTTSTLPPPRYMAGDITTLAFTNFFQLNLPCYHPLAVFLPPLGFTSMLLLNRVRSCARRNLPNPNLLASKRCFLGGTDTSGGLETDRKSTRLNSSHLGISYA